MLLRLHLVSPLKKTPRLVRQQQRFHQAATFGKNAPHAAKLQNPSSSSTALHQKWKELRSRAHGAPPG